MSITRVDSIWAGPQVRGGGITQTFFGEESVSAQACIDAVETFWTSLLGAFIAGNTVEVESTVLVLDEITGNLEGQSVGTSSGPLAGTGTGDPLPPATQGLVRWFTPQVANNRLVRGRTFLPCMREAENDGTGRPSSSLQSAVNASASALISDSDTVLVIWHRPLSPNNGSVGVVQTANMWTEWAQLRGRRD